MKTRRLLRACRDPRLLLGAAGCALALVSLGANVMVARALNRPIPQTPAGITRWSQLEPDRPQAFAANLRALGAPESAIEALQRRGTAAPVPPMAESGPPRPSASDSRAVAVGAPGMPVVPIATPVVPPAVAAAPVAASAAIVSSDEASVFARNAGGGVSTPAASGFSANRPRAGVSGAAVFAMRAAVPVGSSLAATTAAAPAGNAAGGEGDLIAPGANAQIPAAFAPLSPDLNLTDSQQKKVAQVQETFVRNSGANNSTPADASQWQSATNVADDEFRAWFGEDAYLAQQLQTMRSAGRGSAQ